MKQSWIEMCLEMSQAEGFPSGARKIIQNVSYSFEPDEKKGWGDIGLDCCGYTKSKMSMLHRLYYHDESISTAVILWDKRLGQAKYGSVGFTCYNHFIKNDPDKKSKRASVMGPCIQSVTLTLVKRGITHIDCFYRTTELYKKFPADLVFLQKELLPNFDFTSAPIQKINFHFANVTCHPMYYLTLIPTMLEFGINPLEELDEIKEIDPKFYNWVIKWSARYICEEHNRGIDKWAQAVRVQVDALDRIPKDFLPTLQDYLRNNHPGYRNDYVDPDKE